MSFSRISRALRNVGEFPMLAFIPGGWAKVTLTGEPGVGEVRHAGARIQAAALM